MVAARHLPKRGGHGWPNGFWGEGTQSGRNGYLFGETPPPPGESRKWDSWELPTYLGLGTAGIISVLICFGKPDTSIAAWAKPRALKELEEEDELLSRFHTDPEYAAEVRASLRAQGKHPDEYYDLIMMRKEYDVLKLQQAAGS